MQDSTTKSPCGAHSALRAADRSPTRLTVRFMRTVSDSAAYVRRDLSSSSSCDGEAIEEEAARESPTPRVAISRLERHPRALGGSPPSSSPPPSSLIRRRSSDEPPPSANLPLATQQNPRRQNSWTIAWTLLLALIALLLVVIIIVLILFNNRPTTTQRLAHFESPPFCNLHVSHLLFLSLSVCRYAARLHYRLQRNRRRFPRASEQSNSCNLRDNRHRSVFRTPPRAPNSSTEATNSIYESRHDGELHAQYRFFSQKICFDLILILFF